MAPTDENYNLRVIGDIVILGGMRMRFRIFGWHELAYKWIAVVVTVALTTGSIKWSLGHQTDQFTVSIIYALFLFGVGIYITNMYGMIQNEFYRRREQYLNMRNLRVVFTLEKLDSLSDSSLKQFIIEHQVFTARSWTQTEKTPQPLVKIDGFTYRETYIALEERLLERMRNMEKDAESEIERFIKSNNLNTKGRYINIDGIDKITRDIDDWIDDTFELEEEQKQTFKQFLDKWFKAREEELKKHKKEKEKFRKLNVKCLRKVNSIIQRIERTYGDRLKFDLEERHDLQYRLSVMEELVTDIKNSLIEYDDIETIVGERFDLLADGIDLIHGEILQLKLIFDSPSDPARDCRGYFALQHI